jgi:hypothetical protein
MANKERTKNFRHPIRKKIVRVLMIIFLAILFLEFLVYFGSNLLLSNWTRQKVNESTKGVYEVDFNRVNFSLIQRGLFLDGIILKPVKSKRDNQDQALFDLYLDQLAIKGLWYSFSSGVFSIGRIELDNPNLSLDLPGRENFDDQSENVPPKESRVKALETEIKKSIDRLSFAGVYINEIEIVHADLFFLNFLSDNSLKAENTKLIIKEIDWTTQQEWKTPFNAKGFEFDLENVAFPLPDGVHTVSATNVNVSSLENQIDLKGLQLTPDRTKESKAYYDVSLKDLRVGNVDLNTAFMTSKVLIDEIVLANPNFKVERRLISDRDSTSSGNLNDLIDGVLESIEIKELSVIQGSFLTSDFQDSLKNRIEIKDLDFNMIKFYLGNDLERQQNQFFYGQDASMSIKDASLYLSDDIHVIYGESVTLSSFKDEFVIENVRIEPRRESLEALDPDNIIRISLPKLALNNANLKQFYNQGKLEMDELIIDSPKVEFKELNQKEKRPFKDGKASELLKGYMDEVSIAKLQLNNGEVQFTDEAGVRSNDIGFERFSLLLEKVLIRPNLTTSIQDIFLAEEMVLSLDKYRLKLRDNLHEFLAGEVLIDSKNSRVVIKDFSLKPENPDAVKNALDTYNGTVAINVEIPEFRIEGIDLQAAFWDEKLIISQILVPSPQIGVSRYEKKKVDGKTNSIVSNDEVKDLLTSYFSYIKIDTLSFSDVRVRYKNFSGKKEISLNEDSLSLNLKGFLVERGKSNLSESRTFFSEEIDLNLKKYRFILAGGDYEVDSDNLNFNSKSQTIKVENLRLFPSENLKSKISFEIKLPQVAFEGVDLQSFFLENKLIFDNLAVDGSDIELEINREFISEKPKAEKKDIGQKGLPKAMEEIRIRHIEAINSNLSLKYLVGENNVQSIQTKFDLSVDEFFLDSISLAQKKISGHYNEVNLVLEDFSFPLPDSVHTVKFSSLLTNNKIDETIFSNVEIIPNSIMGKVGSPVIAAKIDQLGIQHNTISDVQANGVFDLSKVRLTNPVFDVYLDSEEKKTNLASKKPKNEKAFISSIILQDLLIQEGNITLHNKETGPIPRLAFSNLDFEINDLNLNLMSQDMDLRPQFILEKDLSLSLTNYRLMTKDSLNKLRIGKIKFFENDLTLENVFFGPAIGRYEYMRAQGFQTDAIEASVKKVSLVDLDFDTYFRSNKIKAKKLELDGVDLDVFRDKRLPVKEGVIKPMPQELMQNAPFDMELDSLILRNGEVVYQEFVSRGMAPGFIRFEDFNLNISPFVLTQTGSGYPLKKSILHADTKIMGQGEVSLRSEYFFEPPYPMEMEISMGEFDLTLVNTMLTNGAFVEIVDGRVTDGKWDFKINDDEAWGKMNFRYEDLKIQFLDSVSMLPGSGKLGIMTFLANTITKKSNPRKFFNNRVISDVYYERDKSKFIFSAWWKATFSGLKGSVGLGQPKIPKRRDENEE